MKVERAICERRSVRSYRDKKVPEEKLNKVLEAARMAPSAHNNQPWKFVVVEDDEIRGELAEAANQPFIAQAPVIIAAVALQPDKKMSCGTPSYAVNLAIAVDHMTLAATEQDLGTCWIGAFSQKKVKEILGVPEQKQVVVLMPLGYPADQPKTKKRKDLEQIICENKFEQ